MRPLISPSFLAELYEIPLPKTSVARPGASLAHHRVEGALRVAHLLFCREARRDCGEPRRSPRKGRNSLLRIRRLVEYVGEPEAVLAQVQRSLKEGAHNFPHGRPDYRITVSQLGPAEFVNGDDAVTVALDEQPEAVQS